MTDFRQRWIQYWLRRCGLGPRGRFAARLAGWGAPPFRGMRDLARRYAPVYVAPTARLWHEELEVGRSVYIGDRAVIYQYPGGGRIAFGDRVDIHCDVIVETGAGGRIEIGDDSHVQPRGFLSAFEGAIRIGRDVEIGPGAMFFPHDHRFAAGEAITDQGLRVRGDIEVGDHSWIGAGVIVLSGARIGVGAVIGAGAVVAGSVPPGSIAAGVPARVIRERTDDD